jgi:hypothetical protein
MRIPKPDEDKFSPKHEWGMSSIGMINGVPHIKDNFDHVKGAGSLYSNANRTKNHNSILEIFGCKNCKWCETTICPFRGEVTRNRPHANRICTFRLQLPMAIHDDGVKMTTYQMLQVKGYMDAEFFSNYVMKEHLDGKRDINDVFAWEKLKTDILDKIRKQDEGSKLTVTKNSLDDLRKTIMVREEPEEVCVEEIKEDEQHGMWKEDSTSKEEEIDNMASREENNG